MDGKKITTKEAAKLVGISQQTMRHWCHRYKLGGIDGTGRMYIYKGRLSSLTYDFMEESNCGGRSRKINLVEPE